MAAATDSGIDTALASSAGHAAPFHARNRNAVVLWLFMALWALAVLVATLMLLRGDAPVHGYQWLILALSGLVGIVGCAYACSRPIVSMQLEGTTAQVVERRPFSARITRCSLNEIRVPAISENDVDSDGDPYFRCFLSLPGSHEVEVAGSHRRCEITAIRTRILVAIATQRGVDK